jgi:hypothetical protein
MGRLQQPVVFPCLHTQCSCNTNRESSGTSSNLDLFGNENEHIVGAPLTIGEELPLNMQADRDSIGTSNANDGTTNDIDSFNDEYVQSLVCCYP